MTDPLDIDLDDAELVCEIALVVELMAAAADTSERLSQTAIDRILERVDLAPE